MIHVALLPAIMAVAGFALGLGYFAMLRRTAALLAAGRGWLGPSALTLGRLAAVGIYLAIVAQLGAASLLATFAGFLLARTMAMRAMRRFA